MGRNLPAGLDLDGEGYMVAKSGRERSASKKIGRLSVPHASGGASIHVRCPMNGERDSRGTGQ